MSRYNLSTNTVADLMNDPDVIALVEKIRPGLTTSPDIKDVSDLTVDEALKLAGRYVAPSVVESARAELARL